MILPSIIPLVGLVFTVLTLFHFSQKRSRVVERIRQKYAKQKADCAAADREADRLLLQDLGRSDQPERLIKARIDDRAKVIPNRHQDPEEWTETDLARWLNSESAQEVKEQVRPITLKALGLVIVTVVLTIVAVIVSLKFGDWVSSPSDAAHDVQAPSQLIDLGGGSDLPDSFFSEGDSNE